MQNKFDYDWQRCKNVVVPYSKRLLHPFFQEIDYGLRVFPNALKRIDADLLISPYYDFIVPPNFVYKTIITIHDLCYWDLSDKYRWYTKCFPRFVLPRSINRSAAVITVSEFSKSRIKYLFNEAIQGKSLELVYNTFKIKERVNRNIESKIGRLKRKIGIQAGIKYLLYTGGVENRKNIENMLASFRKLASEESVKLVITGNCKTHPKIIRLLSKNNLHEKVHLTGILSSEELDLLYSNICDGALNLSLYEGFGRNTYEAILYGIPVLCSDIPVNREVGGDYPIYCDPLNVQDIHDKMYLLMQQGRRLPVEVIDIRFRFESNENKMIRLVKSFLKGEN